MQKLFFSTSERFVSLMNIFSVSFTSCAQSLFVVNCDWRKKQIPSYRTHEWISSYCYRSSFFHVLKFNTKSYCCCCCWWCLQRVAKRNINEKNQKRALYVKTTPHCMCYAYVSVCKSVWVSICVFGEHIKTHGETKITWKLLGYQLLRFWWKSIKKRVVCVQFH